MKLAEQIAATGATKAIKQPTVQVSHSAERAMQQQQHSVQRMAATIQPVAAIRASKPSPPTTSFAVTTASILAGQPSLRTAHVRALKPSTPPTSAAGSRASVP